MKYSKQSEIIISVGKQYVIKHRYTLPLGWEPFQCYEKHEGHIFTVVNKQPPHTRTDFWYNWANIGNCECGVKLVLPDGYLDECDCSVPSIN